MKNHRIAALLSFVAGFVDTAGFLGLQGLFTAHVTGNFVTLGAALVLGTHGVVAKLLALPEFILVVALARLGGAALAARRWPTVRFLLTAKVALLIVFFVLAVSLGPFPDSDAPAALATGFAGVAAMAVQNAVQRIHLGSLPPSTLMTGNTTQVVLDAVDLMRGAAPDQAPSGPDSAACSGRSPGSPRAAGSLPRYTPGSDSGASRSPPPSARRARCWRPRVEPRTACFRSMRSTAGLFSEQLVGGRDQAELGIDSTKSGELLRIGLESRGIEDRRIVFVLVVPVQPGQYDAHRILVAFQELLACGRREIDLFRARCTAGEQAAAKNQGGEHLHVELPFDHGRRITPGGRI
jgi:uncharacterized membrane protein YoaK (UPF0700 family)